MAEVGLPYGPLSHSQKLGLEGGMGLARVHS